MATTEHFRNGGGTTLPFSFPILANSDLKVEIYNASTGVWDLKTENTSGQTDNDYTISNTNVVFNSATPSGTGNVHIYRNTNVDNPAAVFAAGSSIRAVDLNDNQTQVLYSTQETSAQLVRETDLKDSIVTSAKIVNGTIVNTDINASAAIAGTKISPNFGTKDITTTGTLFAQSKLSTDGNIEVDGTVDGRDVAADGTKLDTIETNAKDDQTAAEIKTLYLSNGDTNNFDNAAQTKLAGIETAATADQTASEIKTLLQSDKITDSEIATGTLDGRYFTETELTNGALDGRYFTETESDARYFNVSTGDTIKDGDTFPDNDTSIATTAAINDRIIDLVDDVGGFRPIPNQNSFPSTNPDVNGNAGTIVSVQAATTALSPQSGTTLTLPNGRGTGNAVIITGVTATIPQDFGFLVETTSTDHTYAFHRLVPKATEVTTVASNITNIVNAGSNTTNINAVAGNATNINTVAGNNSNITAVANNSSNINSAVSNASNINSAVSNASNINTVAGSISNVNTVAGISGNVTTVAGISSDVTTVANDGTDIGNVAGSIANVNTTAGSISNVNTVAGSISNVNTVAGVSSNVTTVAGISGNVTTVAGISGNVTTVANDGTDIGLVAGSIANVNTTAGDIANVNTVSGSISNVNTVGSNITNVNNASTYLNNFLSLYLGELASDPITDALGNAITEGDLYWNNVTKQLRLYNGSVWQGVSENSLELLKIATSSFSTVYTASAGNNNIDLGGLAVTGAAFSNESFTPIRMSLAKGSATYNLGGI